jgi:hypothetical protein
VIAILFSKLNPGFCSCSGSVGAPGINAPLTHFRARGKLFTASCVDLFTIAIFVSSALSTLPRFAIWVVALKFCAQLDALRFTNNAFAVFPKTPASVEVSVCALAWFAELCPMRKLTTFHADNEASQPMGAAVAAGCTASHAWVL